MAILVTGGLGHIGLSVCRALVRRGHSVLVADRSTDRLTYLEELADAMRFSAVDLLDQASLYRLFVQEKGDIDGVVHIAGLMGGPFFATNPRQHIYINTMGTVDMLEISRVFGVRRFLHISSVSVYGVRDNVPLETDPLTPGDLYGAAKASAEFFGLQYANEFGVDFTALRVSFAYGPGRFPHELYPLYRAVFGCLEGETSISLPAGADQVLDFTYVKDIARAVCLLYEAPNLKYRQYNVGSGVWHRIPELITKAAEIAGVTVNVSIGPGRIMPRGPGLDTSRLREELRFAPEYDFETGVREYRDWIQSKLSRPAIGR
jgi:nucleoside-diphosphate-sugar epimerase